MKVFLQGTTIVCERGKFVWIIHQFEGAAPTHFQNPRRLGKCTTQSVSTTCYSSWAQHLWAHSHGFTYVKIRRSFTGNHCQDQNFEFILSRKKEAYKVSIMRIHLGIYTTDQIPKTNHHVRAPQNSESQPASMNNPFKWSLTYQNRSFVKFLSKASGFWLKQRVSGKGGG